MKKSLVRAVLFSLIAFLVLNFMFFIIAYSIEGYINSAFTSIAAHPALILFWLANPMQHFIWELIMGIAFPVGVGWTVLYIGYIFSLTIASIIAGIAGGSILKAVGGWIITSIISMGLIVAMFFIDSYTITYFCGLCTLNEAIVEIVLPGVVNLLIFSGVALVVGFLVGRSK